MPNKPPTQIYQIKVTLDDTHPPIWRRIVVPANTTLLKLHDILQIVMGWEGYHLHMFKMEGSVYGDPADDEYGDLGTNSEADYKLSQVIQREGQRLRYEYDFGDSWEHTLLVEKIFPPQEGVRYPVCLKGKRACPPEDVGGVWGYQNFLEAIRNPDNDEHEDYLRWVGGAFDPEAFDIEEVNTRLRSMGRGRSASEKNGWTSIEAELAEEDLEPAFPGLQTIPEDHLEALDELPLRRDVVALLAYLRDNKVTGTQSTGNFPLKAVHAICAQFVDPPTLEDAVGEHTYRIRSENDVWPLYFRHVLVSVGELVSGGPGRRWKLTELGEQFLAADLAAQVWRLWGAWWMRTNWAIASPYYFGDGFMPSEFSQLALKHLLELPMEEPAYFEQFADGMIEDAGMVWPIEDQNSARMILHGIIERTLIHPLADFGVLQLNYESHKILGEKYRELSTFRLLPFGRWLLEATGNAMAPGRP